MDEVAHGVQRPSGTVTFLFTDIEQSTRMWETRREAMRVALARHDQLLRSVIESAGGYVFKTVGDSFCAAFSVAVDALAAAVAAQRALYAESWPQGLELRVRMALHSGSCEERGGDYFGPPVNRVARLQATAHGGQVVMSRVTADLVRDDLPERVALRDLGEHSLKDLGQPERVFQLDADGLQSDFPPLASLTNPALRHNLPSRASNFVGRERELADLRNLLNGTRMVTLTGAGGSGKTRLAIQLAAETVDGSDDGVWFVDLAPLADLGFVAGEVARVLGVVEEPGRPVTETLVDVLCDRSLLVVLDNCEHLIDGSAKLADRLLKTCPGVRILATSQEPLRIDGESLYRVPSLSLASSGAATADEVCECEAVQLFVDRATTSDPTFVLTKANAHKILAVCRRLDGIPLAIELAAARLRSMSLAAIEERLDDRFRLLTRGSRTALPRHQTLGALVDWSYDLLNVFEQTVLRRLSVFAGSWNLDAAQAVCADDLESWEVLDLLDSLIDKSLLQLEPTEGESRYRMLETVRQYATEKLDRVSQADGASARTAHAKVFLALAEVAAQNLLGTQQGAWLTRLEADHDNLRAAFTYYLNDPAGAEEALRLGSALRWFWFIRGFFDEGTEFAEAALAHMGAQGPTELRASVLAAAGDLHRVRGEYGTAQSRLEEGLSLARWLDAPALCADLLCRLSSLHRVKGDYRSSGEMADEAVALARRTTDGHVLARALLHRAFHHTDTSNTARVRRDLEEALSCFTREGDQRSVAMTFAQLGVMELRAGNAHEAKAHLLGALDIASQLHDDDELPRILLNLGFTALLRGDLVEAHNDIKGALRIAARTGAQHWITYSLLGLAFCASFMGEDHRAAVLHGASDAIIERIGEAHEQIGTDFRAHDHSRLRDVMGEDFEVAYASGRCLAQTEAVALALDA
jgi:predicted ATPase/class 3 adenylate cyclase